MPLTIVQLTDTHLFAHDSQKLHGCATNRTLRQVVAQIEQRQPQPDLLLLTGDLSQDETPESYQTLRQVIAPLSIPTYWVPGNHDQNLEALKQELDHAPFASPPCFQAGGWNVILLWTMVQGQCHGHLSAATLTQLADSLQAYPTLPTLIALHHHVLPIDSECMDAIALDNAAEFLAIVDQHPQVKIVLCGHIHQQFDQARQGVRYLGSPSTCIQLQPRSPKAVWTDEPPAFRVLNLNEDGAFTTAVNELVIGIS